MFDMRYHIASLVAVFLALAIGILLGTVINDKGVLVDQRDSMVQRIEGSFNTLRDENKTLREQMSVQKEFSDQIVPLAIKDRLVGKNVAIIKTRPVESEVLDNLSQNLKQAGAITNNIEVVENFKITDQVVTQMVPYFPAPTELTIENAQPLMLKKLVEDLTINASILPTSTTTTTIGRLPFLTQLKNIGFIKTDMNLSTPIKPITAATIVGGSETSRNPLDIDMPIILQLKALKVRVVGVETSSIKNSFMRDYQAAGIPTVDNIDQPIGIISAIFTLSGIDGNYGMKKTANKTMPSLALQ